MKNEPFIIERTYDAPIEKVWKAITDKEQMKQWYFDIPAFKAEVGAEFSFTGTDNDGKDWVHLCRVIEVVPNQRLAHTWTYRGLQGESVVTWELSEENGKTKVKLTHAGLETFPSLKSFARENFVEGWTYIVGTSLKKFVEDASSSQPADADVSSASA